MPNNFIIILINIMLIRGNEETNKTFAIVSKRKHWKTSVRFTGCGIKHGPFGMRAKRYYETSRSFFSGRAE